MPPEEKTEEKQNTKLVAKLKRNKQAIALWTAVLTALSSTGIPRIVEMLDDRPSVEEVQLMIATQTEELSKANHGMVDSSAGMLKKIDQLEKKVHQTELSVARLEGVVTTIARHSRRHPVRAIIEELKADIIEKDKPEPEEIAVESLVDPMEESMTKIPVPGEEGVSEGVKSAKPVALKKPIELLRKVPIFNVKQKLQIQELLE